MTDSRKEYADIINRPHHVSQKRLPMSRINRAAQFAPFAALTGYDDLIVESARLTDTQIELSETQKEEINYKLIFLLQQEDKSKAAFTYFLPDERKLGGKHVTDIGIIVRYDELGHFITLDSGKSIDIDSITEIKFGED